MNTPTKEMIERMQASLGHEGVYVGNKTVERALTAALQSAADTPPPQTHLLGSQALLDVAAERQRQTGDEGWSPEHDNAHKNGELAGAAACYVLHSLDAKIQNIQLGHRVVQLARDLWPWGMFWWKPTDRRRDLVKAAALIIAEIERLDRAALAATATEGGR